MTKHRLQATGLGLAEFALLILNTWIISKLTLDSWGSWIMWGLAFSLIITTIMGMAFCAIWFNENKPFTECCFEGLMDRFNISHQEALPKSSGLSDYVAGKYVSKHADESLVRPAYKNKEGRV